MAEPIYEVMVDWDMALWSDEPDFSEAIDDISGYVMGVSFSGGKDKELGNAPASTMEVRLDNSDGRFTPCNTGSPLDGKMLPWRIIRVRVWLVDEWHYRFFGHISKYKVEPHPLKQRAYIYATDGLDLLARQLLIYEDGVCFTADTLVLLANGNLMQIAKMRAGELVKSFDFAADDMTSNRITSLHSLTAKSYLIINENLRVTNEHPFAVGRDEWKTAGELEVGDIVLGLENNIEIVSIEVINAAVAVYNLTVNGTHNYFVSDANNIYLVHNK